MKIERMMETETAYIQIGDRIHVDHYTATCQKITPNGAIFHDLQQGRFLRTTSEAETLQGRHRCCPRISREVNL